MSRLLFGRGAKGSLVAELQQGLQHRGFDPRGIDGIYGRDTVAAVEEFQRNAGTPITGSVSDDEWVTLTDRDVPDIEARSLQVTAAFEGHGYTLIQGNWDGAWLTWGIIGFTLKHGEIQNIVRAIDARVPACVDDGFGSDAPELLRMMDAPADEQEAWANRISQGARVVEPWRTSFERFGSFPEVQAEQNARAHTAYYVPARATAERLNLVTERGIALCFDAQVQNGGVRQSLQNTILGMSDTPELQRLETMATAIADNALPQFSDDVLSRKMTIARGVGTVHGAQLVLANWGIDLVTA
jgi:peptidoglycan hydrolase-like protein with peptidoglycan-binding domain